jgi:exonuclease SbcC
MRLKALRAESEAIQKKAEENERAYGELRGLLEFSGRLQLADGKCPVCNSTVTKLNDMFDVSHLQMEIRAQEQEKFRLQRAKVELRKEEQELLEHDRKIAAAEKFLAHSSISTHDDVQGLGSDLEAKKKDLEKLPEEILKVGPDPFRLAIDATSTSLAEEIVALRQQTSGVSHQKYTDAKLERGMLSRKLQDANRKIGGHQKTIGDAEVAIISAKKTIVQLMEAAEFARMLENIRSQIFNRDGPIGTSLRSWAIKVISEKASDYASLFNIGISRIELAEKARDVSITCYGRQGEIDIDSLSGGEKVAVALALRLGIAFMMGSSKLDFVILDEPTTHLDEDRRKALVRIISDAFREGTGPLSQLIIITHDSDIFEDSEVDRIFRFTMTAEGSKVSQEN